MVQKWHHHLQSDDDIKELEKQMKDERGESDSDDDNLGSFSGAEFPGGAGVPK